MPSFTVRDANASDLDWVLALGNRFPQETSLHTPASLADLVGRSSFVRVIDPAAAFLIGQTETDPALSPNFHWFRERYPAFLYVDRIVVAPERHGQGLGRALYEDAIAHAVGRPVVCEVNTLPPNPGSLVFHTRLGFREVGTARLGPGKEVAYMLRDPENPT